MVLKVLDSESLFLFSFAFASDGFTLALIRVRKGSLVHLSDGGESPNCIPSTKDYTPFNSIANPIKPLIFVFSRYQDISRSFVVLHDSIL